MIVQKRTRIIKWFLFGVLFFIVSSYARTVSVVDQPHAWTETCNWIGATEGLWNVTTNWDCNGTNRVPTTTDRVVIDATLTVNISAQTTVEEVVLGNASGTTSPQLNFSYDAITNGALMVTGGNMTVNQGATVTHTAGTTVVVGTINISVTSGNLIVVGAINTDGKGYNPGQGPGKGAAGNAVASGAGHGGEGGDSGINGMVGGGIYGSLDNPITLGSGGGVDGVGARGGGVAKINVSGTVTVSGTISAKGGANPGTGSSDAGGGSGGSVNVIANAIEGSGTIDVSGTDGYRYGGAGGGGRIALDYQIDTSTVTLRAYGGLLGGSGGGVAASGTIYKKQGSNYPSVLFDNGNRDPLGKKSALNATGTTYSTVTVTNKSRVRLDTTVTINTLECANNSILELTLGGTTNYTSLVWSTGGTIIDRGGAFSLVSGGGDLIIDVGTTLLADYQRSFTNITVNGVLSHSANSTAETYKINLTVSGNFTVSSTGTVNLDAKGYTGGYGPGKGLASGVGATGAGYGGEGGISENNTLASGGAYGSLTDPVNIGSGGGVDEGALVSGGGAIKLTVGGTTTVNGIISANGKVNPASGSDDAGGGSGGSVNIITNVLAGSSRIQASGSNAYRYGGSGGGGRIAVTYTTDISTIIYEAFGGSGVDNAAAGTIYKQQGTNNPIVVIDNAGRNPKLHRSGSLPASILVENLYVQNYGSISLSTATTVNSIFITNNGIVENTATGNTTYSNLTWSTAGTIIDRGGTFSLLSGGGNLVVPLDTTLVADVARTYSNVTIAGTLTHSNNTTAETYKIAHTSTGDYTITGTINVNIKGYSAGYGPGKGVSGNGGGGGSYGGEGGTGNIALGGTPYGSLTQPVNIGSGGGLDGSSVIGGGGAVRVAVNGTLTLNGSITANGGFAIVNTNDIGGGSGGSIWLSANSFAGTGTVTSNGGNGGQGGQYAGSGSGGRIALYANTSTASWQVVAKSGSTNGVTFVTGSAGTIYNEIAGIKSIVIDNQDINSNSCFAYLEAGLTVDNITITNKGSLNANVSGVTVGNLQLLNQGTLRLDSTGVILSTVFGWGEGTTIYDRGGVMPQITDGGSLTIPTSSYLYGDTARNFADLTVNGTLTHTANAAVETYKINYTLSGNLLLAATGAIDVSAKGFASSEGTGQGVDSTAGSGGGGYGGAGGAGTGGAGGIAYGSDIAPNTLGSGGGAEAVGNGGRGGGAAIFSVVGVTTINGSILANGGDYTANDSGGGSGGSIYIQTGSFTGTGTIAARGGGGRVTTAGGGGGGRIAILYSSWNWTGNTLTNTAATSGGTGKNVGAIGTVYLESANEVPTALSVLLESGDSAANLTAGVTTPLVCTATINDPDGYLDISNVEATFYRTSIGYMAANDSNNHYATSCVGGSGSGTNRPYTCTFNVLYHADATDIGATNASDDWSCRITPYDSDGEGVSDVDYIEINSLTAIEVPNQLVLTSAIEPGQQTGNQNAVLGITNIGNTALNVQFSGSDLCTNYPSCSSGGVIGVSNIQFKEIGFTYGGGITLSNGIQLGSFTIVKTTVHPSNQSQNTYWGVSIPTSSIGGVYTGSVLLTGIKAE